MFLNNLYKNVKQGGSIIFDEYYSLKENLLNELFFNQELIDLKNILHKIHLKGGVL